MQIPLRGFAAGDLPAQREHFLDKCYETVVKTAIIGIIGVDRMDEIWSTNPGTVLPKIFESSGSVRPRSAACCRSFAMTIA